jgi:hypothetical protein
MNERLDPNYGICGPAADVLAWQALASTELTAMRAQAIDRADRLLFKCRLCIGGSLLLGDPAASCVLEGREQGFTSLGPWVPEILENGDDSTTNL